MDNNHTTETGSATLRAFILGVILSGIFAWVTALRDNFEPIILMAVNLLPVLPYVALVAAGLLINPILRHVPFIRPFNVSEKLLIFVMCAVASGTASFGLAGRLVPLVATASNPAVNTDQSQIDIYAMPYLNEDYFIMVEGSREAAARVRDAHFEYRNARKTYNTARNLLNGQADVERIATERAQIDDLPTPAMRQALTTRLDHAQNKAESLLAAARQDWKELDPGVEPETVVTTYPDNIEQLKKQRDTLREELRALNQEAFDAVELVRKGLPEQDRAVPGFLYLPGEGWTRYAARVRRWRVGSSALDDFRTAAAALEQRSRDATPLPADWSARITAVADALDPIADTTRFDARNARLSEKLGKLETELAATTSELRDLYEKRRFATASGVDEIEERIDDLEGPAKTLEERVGSLRTQIDTQMKPILEACARVQETQAALRQLAHDAPQADPDAYPELAERVSTIQTAFRRFDATTRRFLAGDAAWELWIGPLANWLVLVSLGYIVFMTFNTLIYRQWAHNEKLIYPIAEITTLIAEEGDGPQARGPPMLKNGLFWLGFAVAAGVLGWNYMADQHIIPNISPIRLQTGFVGYVGYGGRFMSGIASSYFVIIFAVIGLSFLVPANISFSLWFFEILCMGMWLTMACLGYGSNRWEIGNEPRFNLGGGAMLVFGGAILWTCRNYLLCAIRSDALKGLADDERTELRLASAGFLGSVLLLVLLLTIRLEVNVFHTVLHMLMALAITIAMVRAVAEGGVLGLECGFGAFKFLTKVFGTNKAWTAPTLFAPLMIFNGLLIGSLQGFIAPTMANSLKIRERIRIRRLHFHGAIGIAIVVATLVGIITLVIFSYDVGANSLTKWMHKAGGPGIKEVIAAPADPHAIHTRWIMAGALLMIALMAARRSFFWIPHPIGLVVFINPVMYGFWGSIMIGWLIKSLVSKYCSKEQYFQIRCFFVGLVIGHLFAALCGWDMMRWHWG